MRIALIGEYSGLYNNLKDGLVKLGHEVIMVSDGDGSKKFASDISLQSNNSSKILKFKDYVFDIYNISCVIKDFDVVQFVNPVIPPYLKLPLNKIFIRKLIENNQSSFLSCAGDDAVVWDYWENEHETPLRYSWIDGVKKHYKSENSDCYWVDSELLKWNLELAESVDGIIPIMYEYYKPYMQFSKPIELISIPINIDKIEFKENRIKDKLTVFHGLNRYYSKGTNYVEEAFSILKKKYPNDLNLIVAGNMSYNDYDKILSDSNVVVDQVLSYSSGVNGLMSLAKGKIVLGGNEPESANLFGYTDCPILNITPDPQSIVKQVERILEVRNEIPDLSYKSRNFVETYHNYVDVAKLYIDFWISCTK